MNSPKPKGLKAFEGIELATWEHMTEATGLTRNTLRQYIYLGLMPKPEPYVNNRKDTLTWRTDRQDVIEFVEQKAQPNKKGPRRGSPK